jgi:hypothetical protein
MLDRLRAGEEPSVESRRILELLHNLFAFAQDAEDSITGLAARGLPDQFEDFLQTADLSFGFTMMRLKGASRTVASRSRAPSRGASDTGRRERDEARLCAGAAPRTRGRRAGAARRRAACGGARFPCRRRVVVELGPGDCAWSQPAHRAAGARFACDSRQGAVVRSRASASLMTPPVPGFPTILLLPGPLPSD